MIIIKFNENTMNYTKKIAQLMVWQKNKLFIYLSFKIIS